MRNVFFAFVILLFASCTSRPLQLSDLKFVDNRWLVHNPKEALIANRIDTMFLIIDSDTLEYYVYDENGRILENTELLPWYTKYKFQYDSVGLLKADWYYHAGYIEENKISYRFEPDSLLLYQYRYYEQDSDSELYFFAQFKFDKQGKVLEQNGYQKGRLVSKTIYEYNSLEQPIYIRAIHGSDSTAFEEKWNISYFYTNGKLDSVISTWYYDDYKPKKMYYDERGLCYRLIAGNRITNCVYKQRK